MDFAQIQLVRIGVPLKGKFLTGFTENETLVLAEEVYHDVAKEFFFAWDSPGLGR